MVVTGFDRSRVFGDPGGSRNLLGGTCGNAGRDWSEESRSRGLERESGQRAEDLPAVIDIRETMGAQISAGWTGWEKSHTWLVTVCRFVLGQGLWLGRVWRSSKVTIGGGWRPTVGSCPSHVP